MGSNLKKKTKNVFWAGLAALVVSLPFLFVGGQQYLFSKYVWPFRYVGYTTSEQFSGVRRIKFSQERVGNKKGDMLFLVEHPDSDRDDFLFGRMITDSNGNDIIGDHPDDFYAIYRDWDGNSAEDFGRYSKGKFSNTWFHDSSEKTKTLREEKLKEATKLYQEVKKSLKENYRFHKMIGSYRGSY